MKRRSFVKSFCALAGTLSAYSTTGFALASTQVHSSLTSEQHKQIATSIQAGFGEGFRVVSSELELGQIKSIIEHEENTYVVTSADLFDWKIVDATAM